jgi:transcriptional regulator with XRE-family HTH domain
MAATNKNPLAAQAGHKLRQIREDKKMVLRDVEEATLRRFGETGVIRMAQLSRIEKGFFDRISLDDAFHLADIYGVSPEYIGSLYGVWPEQPLARDKRAQQLVEAEQLLRTLDDDLRDDYLNWIEFATMQAKAKSRERGKEPASPTDQKPPYKSPFRRHAEARAASGDE